MKFKSVAIGLKSRALFFRSTTSQPSLRRRSKVNPSQSYKVAGDHRLNATYGITDAVEAFVLITFGDDRDVECSQSENRDAVHQF
ncbi:hypothetical protein SAMN06265222_101874 [Neorhodopirellula lusitana]|uniref:Uncharacterized protein n=1 Tax=Neorhodopirellula lusitana TaxID=445327 RepID=A0ABY1PRW1_9BACT|nr:hypothetical protein SAMN06265222_101874 [Neorhodopirellula lusitana]